MPDAAPRGDSLYTLSNNIYTQFNSNDGRCGVCGDNYADPRPQTHETGEAALRSTVYIREFFYFDIDTFGKSTYLASLYLKHNICLIFVEILYKFSPPKIVL